MATTLMTATIARTKGTTAHLVGHVDSEGALVVNKEIVSPCSLSIVSEGGAIYLWRLNEVGECLSDTWHTTIEDAKSQAEFEFEIGEVGWRENQLT